MLPVRPGPVLSALSEGNIVRVRHWPAAAAALGLLIGIVPAVSTGTASASTGPAANPAVTTSSTTQVAPARSVSVAEAAAAVGFPPHGRSFGSLGIEGHEAGDRLPVRTTPGTKPT